MLTEERQAIILQNIKEKGSMTVAELSDLLHISESTVRRDLSAMDSEGLINKVHGGATARIGNLFSTRESEIGMKRTQFQQEKAAIGKKAASLIEPDDFVYIDAGSTTEALARAIVGPSKTSAIYVTNGLIQAEILLHNGCTVYVLEGRLRSETEAIVGSGAINSLKKYQFTIGFFGTNGVDYNLGYTTPDIEESEVKRDAFSRCLKTYVLADHSKFNHITPVTFGNLSDAVIITDKLIDKRYKQRVKILEADA